jgi:hypothetical protein
VTAETLGSVIHDYIHWTKVPFNDDHTEEILDSINDLPIRVSGILMNFGGLSTFQSNIYTKEEVDALIPSTGDGFWTETEDNTISTTNNVSVPSLIFGNKVIDGVFDLQAIFECEDVYVPEDHATKVITGDTFLTIIDDLQQALLGISNKQFWDIVEVSIEPYPDPIEKVVTVKPIECGSLTILGNSSIPGNVYTKEEVDALISTNGINSQYWHEENLPDMGVSLVTDHCVVINNGLYLFGNDSNIYTKTDIDDKLGEVLSQSNLDESSLVYDQVTHKICASSIIQTVYPIPNFNDSYIGRFARNSEGQVTLDSPMCYVDICYGDLNTNSYGFIMGIIAAQDKIITHGPAFLRIGDTPMNNFQEGVLLTPTELGCKPASQSERTDLMYSGCPRVRVITIDLLSQGLVGCFIN